MDWLMQNTALPNLHPAILHFPIVLFLTAVLFDGLAVVIRRLGFLETPAAILWALGALGAVATYLSGDEAADGLRGLSGAAQADLAEHEDLALMTLIAFSILTLARLALAWGARNRPQGAPKAARIVLLVVALPALGLLGATADRGGKLVFHHGVGVKAGGLHPQGDGKVGPG